MKLYEEIIFWAAHKPPAWKMDVFASQAKELEQENAKLRAQQSNTRLGLEKMEKLITKDYWLYPVTNNEGDLVSLGLMDPTGWEEHLSGKTLADLIDQVNQLEEKDDQA